MAGILYCIPMIIQRLNRRDTFSAFIHYFTLGVIIPFVQWNINPCIKGLIIALLTSVPIMIIVYPKDNKALIPIIIFSLILGAGIGIAGESLID